MKRFHWAEVQPHLKIFPLSDAEIRSALAQWPMETAMLKLHQLAYERHILEPTVGANMAVYDSLMAQLFGGTRATVTYRVFGFKGAHIFKIAKDFGEVLYGLKADVPPTVLSWDNQIYCIEFPDGLEFDLGDGDIGRNAYVATEVPRSYARTWGKASSPAPAAPRQGRAGRAWSGKPRRHP